MGDAAVAPTSLSYSMRPKVAQVGLNRSFTCVPAPTDCQPPPALYTGSPDASDCAWVMLKYGLSAPLVTTRARGPPDRVKAGDSGTTASTAKFAVTPLAAPKP